MADWMLSRLVVTVDDDVITPIESFTPSFAFSTEVQHSLEATHVAYVANPDNFTFSMTVRAIGNGAAKLTQLAMNGTRFKIQMVAQDAEGNPSSEWEFESVVLDQCLITSAAPSNATINGAPAATFSGVALKTTVDSDSLPSFVG